jgi:hypothetical protein
VGREVDQCIRLARANISAIGSVPYLHLCIYVFTYTVRTIATGRTMTLLHWQSARVQGGGGQIAP